MGRNTKTIDTAVVCVREATTVRRGILGSRSTPIVPIEER